MDWIIIDLTFKQTAHVVVDSYGNTLYFDTEDNAVEFAEEIALNTYMVVQIH